MRLLAFSDLHNNVACVRKLRAQEANDYDAIAIAGDIGSHRATEIFDVLRSFKCPIVYVYGNWDRNLGYDRSFGKGCHLIHLNVVRIGRLTFTGFSYPRGLDPRTGRRTRNLSNGQYAEVCRRLVAQMLAERRGDLRRTVFMSHDRTPRLAEAFPGLLLHLYGHVHRYEVLQRGATTYVNLSALDRMRAVRPAGRKTARATAIRYVNAGNYSVIEVARSGRVSVECRLLQHAYAGWTDAPGHERLDGPLVPEETAFGDNVRTRESPRNESLRATQA
jgi:Calcineurin-like phosphoesterase superfamily domain